jgi:hypothetical protein
MLVVLPEWDVSQHVNALFGTGAHYVHNYAHEYKKEEEQPNGRSISNNYI